MKTFSWLPACFCLVLLASCSGPKPITRPMEKYREIIEEKRSVISVPIELGIRELELNLNQQLGDVLYEDNDLRDGDKMMMRVVKQEDIRLQVDSQRIEYRVPVSLWLRYNAGIATVEANGNIVMDFRTEFRFTDYWGIETETTILRHEWVQKPLVRMGMVNIPLGGLSNIILRNTRSYMARTIDRIVRNNLQLEEIVADTWRQMYEPMLVSPEYNTWLLVNPQSIGMTPIKVEEDTLTTMIVVEGRPQVKLGAQPPALTPLPLPLLSQRPDLFEGFVINIGAEVSYEEAERLARQQLVGETFSYGKRKVTVEDVELFGQEDKVIVNTVLKGTYNGSIYLEGVPSFNVRKNTIEIKDLDFTLDTRNVLFKSAGWLLKGPIKNRIEDNMNFLVDYNLTESREMIRQQLASYILGPGLELKGEVNELSIQDVYPVRGGLHADLLVTGKLKVTIQELGEKD